MNLTNYEFYNNGTPGASAVVGVSDRLPRNVRYSFTAPSTGASAVSLRFQGAAGSGTTPEKLRFAITTDPTAYAAANWNTQGSGVVTRIAGGYAYEGSASVLLLPGLTYYLFLWPDTSTFGWVRWYTADGYATLETTGGAYSSLAVPPGTLGSSLTLQVTRYDAAFSHRVAYTFGKESGLIYEGNADTFSWTPPLSLASQIPAAAAGNAVYSITTFDGNGNQVGTAQTVTAPLAVPDSVVPTVTFTWEDATGKALVYGDPVQNVSALAVAPTAAGAYGSTVTATAVMLNGVAYAGGILTAAGSLTLSVTVTDSRGRTATAEQTVNVIAYQAPQLTLTASRCTADGTLDDEGEYALITVNGALSLLGGQNSGVLQLSYASGEGGAVYKKTEDPVAPADSFWYQWVVEAPSAHTLEITADLLDRITAARRSMTLSVGYATLDFLAGGKGIAFGTTAKEPGFTCAMDASFTGSVQVPQPQSEQDAVPKSYADRAKDYVTSYSREAAGNSYYDKQTWSNTCPTFKAPRAFFNTDNPDVLAWAKAMLQNGFDGVAHFQLGYGATSPVTYCMGLLIANAYDRAEVIIFGATAFYHNQNLGGTWSGWRKTNTTAI